MNPKKDQDRRRSGADHDYGGGENDAPPAAPFEKFLKEPENEGATPDPSPKVQPTEKPSEKRPKSDS